MTDRELLEAAAKAAGVPLKDWREDWSDDGHEYGPAWRTTEHELWNPLTDDGDALRLAGKLRISIMHAETAYGRTEVCYWDSQKMEWRYTGVISKDPYESTRQSIVLAAAEIGGCRD